jgi:leucyl aminopeptidase (aminopeptidase T)
METKSSRYNTSTDQDSFINDDGSEAINLPATNSKKSTISDLETKVARKVATESLHLKKGDSVTVETWNNGFSLAKKFVVEARKLGAHPIMIFEDEDAYIEGVRSSPRDSVGKMGKHEYGLLSVTDAYFFIPNELLEGYAKRLTPDEVDESTSYGTSWYEAAEKSGLRGARMSFGFAGRELAKMLEKKLDDIVVHQLKACLVDFDEIKKRGEDIQSHLTNNGKGVLVTGDSQLEFEFGEDVRIEDGRADEQDVSKGYNVSYLPPGMLTKSVKPDSVNGKVRLSPSLTWRGVLNDAVLEFEKGALVKWSSRSSKEKLDSLISDRPERKLDEISIGLNPLVRYGYGEDRFVAGSLGVDGLGFTGIVKNGTLRAEQTTLVEKGRLPNM